jgi:hypothetical protein
MDEQRRRMQGEEEGGQAAHNGSNRLTTFTVSGGGFAPGRFYNYSGLNWEA